MRVVVQSSGFGLRLSAVETSKRVSMRFFIAPHPPQEQEELPQQDVVTAQNRGKGTKRTLVFGPDLLNCLHLVLDLYLV